MRRNEGMYVELAWVTMELFDELCRERVIFGNEKMKQRRKGVDAIVTFFWR